MIKTNVRKVKINNKMLRVSLKRQKCEIGNNNKTKIKSSNDVGTDSSSNSDYDDDLLPLESKSERYNDTKQHIDPTTVLGDIDSEEDEGEQLLKQVLFGNQVGSEDSGFSQQYLESKGSKPKKKKKIKDIEDRPPVWHDEDDHQVKVAVAEKLGKVGHSKRKIEVFVGEAYHENLKTKFKNTVGEASWAKLKWQREDHDDHDSEDDKDLDTSELLRSTGDYLESSDSLAKGCLQTEKCTNVNKESPTSGKLTAVEFHPTAQVILTAGRDQRLNIFQVDGKDNPKIQSVFLDQFPINTAHFTCDGTEVIMGSKQKRGFYYYDMMAGKVVKVQTILGIEENHLSRFVMSPDGQFIVFFGHYGRMHFISTKSKEWIDTIKMNGQVSSVAFNNDGSRMYSHGTDGQVYIWDMNSRSCIHKFADEGTINGRCIAVSKNNSYIATGCESGIVNIYDCSHCQQSTSPTPITSIKNLVTSCTSALFNPTTEILAISSQFTPKAVKMVHIPSMTVFSDFPDQSDRLNCPMRMDFSLNSGYFCVGDKRGSAHLYRIKHYGNY